MSFNSSYVSELSDKQNTNKIDFKQLLKSYVMSFSDFTVTLYVAAQPKRQSCSSRCELSENVVICNQISLRWLPR